MYSIYEVFLAVIILSAVAAYLGKKHGFKRGVVEGYGVGVKVATRSIVAQLRAKGINAVVAEGEECPCAECVADRAASKKP